MVCLGNICRSPLAEGILQQKAFKAGLNWSVESAGTNSYHIGDPPHHLSQKIANSMALTSASKERGGLLPPILRDMIKYMLWQKM